MSTAEHDLSAAEATEAVAASETTPPPAGEEIHLPGGSILPLTTAIGITLGIIGLTIWLVWTLVGIIITVISVSLWVRDVRHDVADLPEDHHHH